MFYDSAIGTVRQQTTAYTLHGKNIVHWSSGTNAMHFFYDAQNRPAVVVHNGKSYGYLYNLQGDVIALIDSSGNRVVEYRYDAWGRSELFASVIIRREECTIFKEYGIE